MTGDLYCQLASRITGQQITPNDKEERRIWKIVFLAQVNGQSTKSLAADMKVNISTARGYVEKFALAYPDIAGILGLRGLELAMTGELRTWMGRVRRVSAIYWVASERRVRLFLSYASGEMYWFDVSPIQISWRNITCFVHRIWAVLDYRTRFLIYTSERGRIGTKYYPKIDTKQLMYLLPVRNLPWSNIRRVQRLDNSWRPVEESKFEGMDAARRVALNSAIMQGSTADLLTSMMLRSKPVAVRHGASLLASIHDELLFTVPLTSRDNFIRELGQVLESPISDRFPIPILIDIACGPRFGSMKEI